jgi:hypothetical protein
MVRRYDATRNWRSPCIIRVIKERIIQASTIKLWCHLPGGFIEFGLKRAGSQLLIICSWMGELSSSIEMRFQEIEKLSRGYQ